MVRESELDDIKKQANSIMVDELDPTGTITRELDMTEEQNNWSTAVNDLKNSTNPDRASKQKKSDIKKDQYVLEDPASEPLFKTNDNNSDAPEKIKPSE